MRGQALASDSPLSESAFLARSEWEEARNRRRAYKLGPYRRVLGSVKRRRLLLSIVFVFLVLAGSVATAYSPLMSLKHIVLEGNNSEDNTAIMRALEGEMGRPLALIKASSIRDKLAEFPLIQSFSLELKPPGTMVIHLLERTIQFAIREADGYRLTDSSGVAIKTVAKKPAEYPEVQVDMAKPNAHAVLSAIGQVLRLMPEDLKKRVASVSASSPENILLVVDGGAKTVFWGGDQQVRLKSRVLEALLLAVGRTNLNHLDVSAPQAPAAR